MNEERSKHARKVYPVFKLSEGWQFTWDSRQYILQQVYLAGEQIEDATVDNEDTDTNDRVKRCFYFTSLNGMTKCYMEQVGKESDTLNGMCQNWLKAVEALEEATDKMAIMLSELRTKV